MFPLLPTKVVSRRRGSWGDLTWIVVRPKAYSVSMRLSCNEHGHRQKGRSHREPSFYSISQFHDSLSP
jgi:hypothetical protein